MKKAKRFYRNAAIGRADGGFSVLLENRPVRTPAGARLVLPTAVLAAAVVNEWLAQSETLRPETMPLTRLAATALDRIGPYRAAVVDALAEYAGSDLICYRAEDPLELVALQTALWQPLVDWAAQACGAQLAVCAGVLPLVQPQPALDALRAMIEATSDRQLAALASVVPASGSLVVALAMLHGRLDAEGAVEAALLDERWQAERWGVDQEAEARRAEIADDIRSAALFLSLASEEVTPVLLPGDAAAIAISGTSPGWSG
ncbi:MAG: ATPase [Rhodospirillales bacterium]|nr:ATPase [Rhodospirillales bacterium]